MKVTQTTQTKEYVNITSEHVWYRTESNIISECDIGKLKSHKSPGIDEILAELIKAGGGTICGEIHKLITSIWKKEKLPEEWNESIIVPSHKKGIKQILIIIGVFHFCQPLTKFYLASCSQG